MIRFAIALGALLMLTNCGVDGAPVAPTPVIEGEGDNGGM